MSADAALLAEVPLFQLLDEEERMALAVHLEVVTYPVNHVIFNYGEPGDTMYIIRSGEAEVSFKNDTGEKIVLEVATRGDFFGELSFLDGGSRSATVRVLQDLEVFLIDRKDLDEYLHRHPKAALDLLAALGKRLRRTSDILRHTATRNVNEEVEDKRTVVQKSADWIAEFSGSIPFLMMHVFGFTAWIVLNTVMPESWHFDTYPFGFLTLCVSLEAIFLSVFVLLSQNRQAIKDRVRADIEYDVNLRAELEVAHLHEKLDKLNIDVLNRLDRLAGGTTVPRRFSSANNELRDSEAARS
jgi:CRP/FNR family cyclic AMP-dependent transcriptional regulator